MEKKTKDQERCGGLLRLGEEEEEEVEVEVEELKIRRHKRGGNKRPRKMSGAAEVGGRRGGVDDEETET